MSKNLNRSYPLHLRGLRLLTKRGSTKPDTAWIA